MLKDTLESVYRQHFQYIEHIVIDGGSEDATLETLKHYESLYNLKYISEPDDGIADALNKGLKIAEGQYIHVLQTDDRFLHNKVLGDVNRTIQLELSEIYRFNVVYGSSDRVKLSRNFVPFLWWNRFRNVFPHQGMFVRRDLFGRIGKFDDSYSICMDYDFFYRALQQNTKVISDRMPVCLVGRGGVSSRVNLWQKRLWEEKRIQMQNEKNVMWKYFQMIFNYIYFPYKLYIAPKLFYLENQK